MVLLSNKIKLVLKNPQVIHITHQRYYCYQIIKWSFKHVFVKLLIVLSCFACHSHVSNHVFNLLLSHSSVTFECTHVHYVFKIKYCSCLQGLHQTLAQIGFKDLLLLLCSHKRFATVSKHSNIRECHYSLSKRRRDSEWCLPVAASKGYLTEY